MFNELFGIGKAYKKLPPHKNFKELSDNIEKLANNLIDQSLGSFGNEGYLNAPGKWQWQLGNDLKMLVDYARDNVSEDTDGLHYFSERNQTK
jgi:hypothetical protein